MPIYGIGRDWLMWLIGQMLCHVLNKNHAKVNDRHALDFIGLTFFSR